MEVTILFDEEILRKQHDLLIKESWKKYRNQYNKILFYSIPIIALSLIIFFFDGINLPFVVLFSLGFHYLITYTYGVLGYKKSKKKFKLFTDSEIDSFLLSDDKKIKYEFNEGYFSQSTHKLFIKAPWKALKGFKVVDNNIIIAHNFGQDLYYLISKEEVSEDIYENLILFLQNKIPNLGK